MEAKLVKHLGESRIAVFCDNDKQLIAHIKQLEDAKWSLPKQYLHFAPQLCHASARKWHRPAIHPKTLGAQQQ